MKNSFNIDPRNYRNITCSNCGNILFETKYVLKEISGKDIGEKEKKYIIYPLQVLVCSKCGNILKDDIQAYKLDNFNVNESTNIDSLLL